MPTIDELAARLDRVESQLALHRLAHDYCVAADQRDAARWARVWTADAVWATGPDQAFTGVEAIRDAIERQWDIFPRMQHSTANHVVTIDGDTATGRADVVVLAQLPDLRWIIGGAIYEDDYRRVGGDWRIARRGVARPFDLAPLPPSEGFLHYDEESGTVRFGLPPVP